MRLHNAQLRETLAPRTYTIAKIVPLSTFFTLRGVSRVTMWNVNQKKGYVSL